MWQKFDVRRWLLRKERVVELRRILVEKVSTRKGSTSSNVVVFSLPPQIAGIYLPLVVIIYKNSWLRRPITLMKRSIILRIYWCLDAFSLQASAWQTVPVAFQRAGYYKTSFFYFCSIYNCKKVQICFLKSFRVAMVFFGNIPNRENYMAFGFPFNI